MKISACLVVYEDPDILRAALASIAPVADQIVVVDGPYQWLLPFLPQGAARGRSSAACLDILAEFEASGKVKYRSGIWKNELEKRQFAYAACDHEVVYLIDADEVHELDHHALEAFLGSGKSVAGLASPLLVTDRIVQAPSAAECLPLKPMLFRRDRVSSLDHLGYLWLVLPPAEQAQLPSVPADKIWQSPVGISHHLSQLRGLDSSISRTRFYFFNWMRHHKIIPWLRNLPLADLAEMSTIFGRWPALTFERHLLGQEISLGFTRDGAARYFPFTPSDRVAPILRDQFAAFRASVDGAAEISPECPRTLFEGHSLYIDVTDRLPPHGAEVTFSLSTDKAGLIWQLSVIACFVGEEPRRDYRLEVLGEGTSVSASFCPPQPAGPSPFRSLLRIEAWWPDDGTDFVTLQEFRLSP